MESDQASILIILIILGALFIGVRLILKFDEKSAERLGPSRELEECEGVFCYQVPRTLLL